jgi:quercetin dioxygenase-like cupin family protein
MSALKDSDLAALGVGIAHFFGGGAYIKETLIPKGAALAQHGHEHDHLSYLVRGCVMVTVDGVAMFKEGPACLTIEAGKIHTVQALTDALWLCVWATDCTDPERVDDALTGAA